MQNQIESHNQGGTRREIMVLREWLVSLSEKSLFLTIEDVVAMEEGSRARLLFIGRDALRPMSTFEHRRGLPPVRPEEFFADGFQAEFVRGRGLEGTAVWNVPSWRADRRPEPFSFHVEYETGRWSPHAAVGWAHLPDSARVGWRGPAVFWDSLAAMPEVYLPSLGPGGRRS